LIYNFTMLEFIQFLISFHSVSPQGLPLTQVEKQYHLYFGKNVRPSYLKASKSTWKAVFNSTDLNPTFHTLTRHGEEKVKIRSQLAAYGFQDEVKKMLSVTSYDAMKAKPTSGNELTKPTFPQSDAEVQVNEAEILQAQSQVLILATNPAGVQRQAFKSPSSSRESLAGLKDCGSRALITSQRPALPHTQDPVQSTSRGKWIPSL